MRAKRNHRERGASLTEFAIVIPVIVAMFYGAIYLTELGAFKLKSQEIARYSTWAFTQHPLSAYDDEDLKHNEAWTRAREAVAELVGKGGFPPIYLAPVNFDALYAQQLQQQQTGTDEAH